MEDTSTLSLGVRTSKALQDINELKTALTGLTAAAAQLGKGAGVASVHSITAPLNEASQAARTAAMDLRNIGEAADAAGGRIRATLSRAVGGARVSMKSSLEHIAADAKDMDRAIANSSSLLALKKTADAEKYTQDMLKQQAKQMELWSAHRKKLEADYVRHNAKQELELYAYRAKVVADQQKWEADYHASNGRQFASFLAHQAKKEAEQRRWEADYHASNGRQYADFVAFQKKRAAEEAAALAKAEAEQRRWEADYHASNGRQYASFVAFQAKKTAALQAEMAVREEAARRAAKLDRQLALRSLTAPSGASRAQDTLFADMLRKETLVSSALVRQSVDQLTKGSGMYSARDSVLAGMLREEDKLAKATKNTSRAVSDNARIHSLNANAMRDAHSAARGLAGSLNSIWMTWGAVGPILAGAAAGGVLRGVTSVGTDLEYRLRFIEALGNQAAKIQDIMPAAMNSMFKPTEVAEGLRQLTQAGLDTQKALAVLPSALQLATVGEMSVEEAALTATSALSSFNLQVADAARVGDVFAKAAAISNTNVKGIAEAMKQAATSSSLYGISVEETAGQLAVLATRGIFGSSAGTAIKNFERELYAPIEKGRKALEQVGVSAYDANGKVRPFRDVMADLARVTSSMNSQTKSSFLKDVFNERGMRAAAILLDDYKGLLTSIDELEDSDGFMANANALLLDTTKGAANRMASVLQQSFAQAYQQAEPEIRSVLSSLTQLFGSQEFVTGVTALTSGLARVTGLLAENGSTITWLIALYAGMRATTTATSLGLDAFGRASELLSSRKRAQAMATIAATAATQSETAASTAATVAGSARIAQVSKLTSALGLATRAFGLVGIAVSGAITAYEIFSAMTPRAVSAEELRARKIQATTTALDAQINALRERLRLEGTDPGAAKIEAATTLEELKIKRAETEARLESARQRASGYSESITDGGAAGMRSKDARRAIAEKNRAAQEYAEASKELDTLNGKIEEYQSLQAKARIADARSAPLGQMNNLLNQLDMASVKDAKGNYTRWGEADGYRDRVLAIKAELTAAKDIEAARAASFKWAKLESEISSKLPGRYQSSSAGKKGDSLIFRSSTQNMMTEYSNQKQLLEMARDAELDGVRKLRAVGAYTDAQAVAERERIWDGYVQSVVAKAQAAAASIAAQEKGSAALKELAVAKVREDMAQERRLADAEQEIQRQKDLRAAQLAGLKAVAEATDDLHRIEVDLNKDRRNQIDSLRQLTLTDRELAILEARNDAEDRYNSALKKQQEVLSEIRRLNPGVDVSATPGGAKALEAIGILQASKTSAMDQAGSAAGTLYDQSQSFSSGALQAFARIRSESMKTGEATQRALTNAFDSASSAVDSFVTTGKIGFRSFTSSVLGDIAKIYARMAMTQLFSGLLTAAGGAAAGGVSGASASYTQGGNAVGDVSSMSLNWGVASAKGNAFSNGRLTAFAKGGAFTNSVVGSPTVAPMALFGEAGPEAIMPLTRTHDGSLGIRAVPYGAEAAGASNAISVQTNVYIQSDGTTKSQTTGNEQAKTLGNQITAAAKDVIRRETRQGGLIDSAIKNRR